jgi:hypothetical protein
MLLNCTLAPKEFLNLSFKFNNKILVIVLVNITIQSEFYNSPITLEDLASSPNSPKLSKSVITPNGRREPKRLFADLGKVF